MYGKTRDDGATRWGLGALVIGTCLTGCRSGTAGPDVANARGPRWQTVSIELPVSKESFPPGRADAIANGQCLICHSAGMVLSQPPLTRDVWKAEIMKMRSVYGAPIPVDQVDELAEYLHAIDGR